MKENPRPARRVRGFTLIEILVAMLVVLVLAGLTIGGMAFVQRKQRDSKAELQIALLSNALESYKADFGVYPAGDGSDTSTADLREELHPPKDDGGGENTGTVYLSDLGDPNPQGWGESGEILDPWGNPYRYRSPGQENPDFDLWSIGADEVEGTGDDITNW